MKAGADEEEVNVIVLHTGDYMGDYSLATGENKIMQIKTKFIEKYKRF